MDIENNICQLCNQLKIFRFFKEANLFLCDECYLYLLNSPMNSIIYKCEICKVCIESPNFYIKNEYICCYECSIESSQ